MSLHQIKVAREDVLKIVRENKEKHDGILKTAIEGYWIDAESYLKKYEKDVIDSAIKNHKIQLKKLRKEHKAYVKSVKALVKDDLEKVKNRTRDKGFHYWRGPFPEDHGDDYLGTIRRLELCVDPEIELDNNEFDAYIRNKWSWKNSFITSNSAYVSSWATASYCIGNVGVGNDNSYHMLAVSSSYALTGSNSLTALASF